MFMMFMFVFALLFARVFMVAVFAVFVGISKNG
jgi:hypothetical protein